MKDEKNFLHSEQQAEIVHNLLVISPGDAGKRSRIIGLGQSIFLGFTGMTGHLYVLHFEASSLLPKALNFGRMGHAPWP